MSQEEIIVTKKTKKSESTFDMKPFIYACSFHESDATISMTIDASSSGNLKPSLVVKTLCEQNNFAFDEFGLLVTREETYMNVGEEGSVQLEPLSFAGSDY